MGRRGRVMLTPALESELATVTLEAVEPLAAAGKLSCLLLQCSRPSHPTSTG